MLSWIYHGRNLEQCWNEPNCIICYAYALFEIIFVMRVRWRKSKN